MPITKQEELELKAAAYDLIKDICNQNRGAIGQMLDIAGIVSETNKRLQEGRNDGT